MTSSQRSPDSDFVTNVYDMPKRFPTSLCVRPASSLAAINLARKASYRPWKGAVWALRDFRVSPSVGLPIFLVWVSLAMFPNKEQDRERRRGFYERRSLRMS